MGPCVDQRAAMANALHPDAIVSIHADGGPPEGRGFHVNYSNPPLNDAQAGPAIRFAQAMRDQLVASGVQPSTYRGTDGLYGRADLADLNLAQYPSILIEMGNMKNAEEAAVLTSTEGSATLPRSPGGHRGIPDLQRLTRATAQELVGVRVSGPVDFGDSLDVHLRDEELAAVQLPVTTVPSTRTMCLGVARRGNGGWGQTDVCGRVAPRRHSR